jgi:hypothetical protein
MENHPKGIEYQVYLFQRDYRNGVAISERYLALINSPEYLTAGSRDKQKRSLGPSKRKPIASIKQTTKRTQAIEIATEFKWKFQKDSLFQTLESNGWLWDVKFQEWFRTN